MKTDHARTSSAFEFATSDSWATLNDGTTVKFREVRPEDTDPIRELYAGLSPRSIYLRFFTNAAVSVERDIERLVRRAPDQHEALVALHNGELVAVGCYEVLDDPTKAEIAMVMGEHHHGLGLGSALVRHLAIVARARGIKSFVVEALGHGDFMAEVVHNLDLPIRVLSADLGTIEYEVELP